MLRLQFFSLLLLCCMGKNSAWHLFGNSIFHCWPIEATAANAMPWTGCDGIQMSWIEAPPSQVRARDAFNVTYSLSVDNSVFWPWAVRSDSSQTPAKYNIFRAVNATTSSEAETWCLNTTCPSDPTKVDVKSCCVHHVNVHSCPFASTGGSGLCGPWIPPNGQIVTHSTVLYGPLQLTNWTSTIPGLYELGINYIIAHFKFASMHLALNAQVDVVARAVCGNGLCETDENESCESCVKDCGFCPLTGYKLALVIVAIALLAVAGIIVLIYLRVKAAKQFWDERWIIQWDAVKEDNTARGFMGSAISVNVSETGSRSQMAASAAQKQIFTKIGVYEGKTLAVKPVTKKHFMLTKNVRKQVHAVRQLDHVNLVRFIGMSVEIPHVAIYSEYCPKGSLNDVLQNEDVPLNWAFRFAFATDIGRGMSYLHSHKIFHGRLKSQNCIIDDRWTVKIADYGLHEIRQHELNSADAEDDEVAEAEEYRVRNYRAYRAPELEAGSWEGTAPGDVYAMGVILIEIGTRNDPYGDDSPDMLEVDWRPLLPDDFTTNLDGDDQCPKPVEYKELVEECMAWDAEERPAMEKVKKQLQTINPDKKSAVDLMMAMMEKYSKHLEAIVSERTQELTVEKQKTDRLLYSMLPQKVAEDLKLGRTIAAEQFAECTIYFSDIVGFTSLSGGSTPLQVVALLNKLYTCFDSVIDRYDVYKVETIGDAYMVVSGVPLPNGHDHVREVSLMSIDLVSECESFEIPHRPNEPLKIRIGLHSGSVCAGVVGLKMPRYCLFGDTVNTASRMESNGEAWKIHCSSSTYSMLTEFHEGFQLTKRGAIPIKGKGDMVTWWLTGREGHVVGGGVSTATEKKPLPTREPSAELLALPSIETDIKQRKISTVSSGGDSGFGGQEVGEHQEGELAAETPGIPEDEEPSEEEISSDNHEIKPQIRDLPSVHRPARLPPLLDSLPPVDAWRPGDSLPPV